MYPPSTEGVEELAPLLLGLAMRGAPWAKLYKLAQGDTITLAAAARLAQGLDGRSWKRPVPFATVLASLADALEIAVYARLLEAEAEADE